MKNLITVECILLLFFVTFRLQAQTAEIDIRILQDKRPKQSTELLSWLRSSNERERELALLAIANIQDTSSLDLAAFSLNDPSVKVRSMAAFAVGMIGKPRGAAYLFQRLKIEATEQCAGAIFNAIGLCGTTGDLQSIVAMKKIYFPSWKPFVAQSIFRFANRNVKDVNATRYAAELLSDQPSMRNALYALMRINDTTVTKENREQLLRLLADPSPVIRMWAASTVKVFDDDGAVNQLLLLAKRDGDWRVRVNAIGALRTKVNCKNDMVQLFGDRNEHVALSAVSAYASMAVNDGSDSDAVMLQSLLRSDAYVESVKEEIRGLVARKLGEAAIPFLEHWRSPSPFFSAKRVRALGGTHSEKAIPLVREAMLQSDQSLVTIAGIEAYQTLVQKSSDSLKKDFLNAVIGLFHKKDPGISYSTASVFQDSALSQIMRREYLPQLVTAFQEMNAVSDLEPMVELLNVFSELPDSSALPAVERGLKEPDVVLRTAAEKAFRSVTGKDAPPRFEKDSAGYRPFYSTEDLKLLLLYTGADVFTSKGKIRILFEKEAAPFTVLNFILLAQKNFYQGLTFHRVVSNFVIQGGDPIGNGSGGPGYAIRTEVHPEVQYREGSVGMASAGKDTEGSQWFVTHCPTPHLDYRYTIFGYTKDQNIVDKIMVGDTIDRIELLRGTQ